MGVFNLLSYVLAGTPAAVDTQNESPNEKQPVQIPYIPVDLVYNILECVDSNEDLELLKSCSLVCKSWSIPSQKLLFQRVTLTSESAYKSFTNAVKESPSLATSVRDLKVVLDPNQPNGLKTESFATAVLICPRLTGLDITLYGEIAPGEDVIGAPNQLRLQRTASRFSDEALSMLGNNTQISALKFTNYSDNQESLFQLLPLWPALETLSLAGTAPALSTSTSTAPPACALRTLRTNFQTFPSLNTLQHVLHNSSSTLSDLSFAREPSSEILTHLLISHPISSLSVPSLPRRKPAPLHECKTLKSLSLESPYASSILYRNLPDGIEHIALGVNKNTAVEPITAWMHKRTTMLKTVSILLWEEPADLDACSALKPQGVQLDLYRDVNVFRTRMQN